MHLIVPLFVSAFQRSDELANAMEARGYNPQAKRTRYRTMHSTVFDWITGIFTSAIMVGVILISVYDCVIFVTPHFLPALIVGALGLLALIILVLILGAAFAIATIGARIKEAKGNEQNAEISFLCGILSLLFLLSIFGSLIAGTFGIISGIKAKKGYLLNKSRANIGIGLSIAGIVLSVIIIGIAIFWFIALSRMT